MSLLLKRFMRMSLLLKRQMHFPLVEETCPKAIRGDHPSISGGALELTPTTMVIEITL
jgi:hypothetical protein